MKRVRIICEGQTEEEFVLKVLAPACYSIGLNLIPEMIETSPGHKGGALQYDRVKRHLRNTLRQKSAPIVTTLFDLYRLDNGFPGFADSLVQPDLQGRLKVLKQALHADIVDIAECAPERFIPYLQPHEFEALLFSDVQTLVTVQPSWESATPALMAVRGAAASPEHINHSRETKPAAHLERKLKHPSYRKRLHGPIAAQQIGLHRIEAECSFFAGWLQQLRNLATPHDACQRVHWCGSGRRLRWPCGGRWHARKHCHPSRPPYQPASCAPAVKQQRMLAAWPAILHFQAHTRPTQ